MAEEQAPSSKGLSLYANLLDHDGSATISSAPVTYNKGPQGSAQDEAAKQQQAIAASIRFQPTKRPQLAAQKAKAKAIASKLAGVNTQNPSEVKQDVAEPPHAAPKLSAADWTATVSEDEDVNAYAAGSRVRGGKKRKKKNKESARAQQDWDDIYDPSRPNNYEEYKHSEEKIREVRDWKDLLYRHRMRQHSGSFSSTSSEKSEQRIVNSRNRVTLGRNHANGTEQFAPPPSFAPPPATNDEYTPPPPPPPEDAQDAVPGENAYQRRLQMSQTHHVDTASRSPPPPPPPPPPDIPPTGQISRAPVRYNLPPPPLDIPMGGTEEGYSAVENEAEAEADASRSNRPGQKGFAERLLTKYGWTKGTGLGAQGQGIINPLYVKADKRKKKSDAEGGGYATPAGTGKILGGNKSKHAQKEEEGKFGAMSEVIRLEGMLNGMDVQTELSKTDETGGGLMQEIGEECGEKYGSVERVFIHIPQDVDGEAVVFVRFVSQLSALRAVNALEGRTFNGNIIKAQFWDKEKFDDGIYI